MVKLAFSIGCGAMGLSLLGMVLPATAQTRPILSLKLPAQHPSFTVSGDRGAIYSIQYTDALSSTNSWTDRTLVQLQTTQLHWTDPSTMATGQLFFRAAFVPAPADTNLLFIPPGTFLMGSPASEALRFADETNHFVTITRGFWMSRYLVRQQDYLAVVGNNPSFFIGDATRPVERVNWYNATNYCWLRTQQEQAAGVIPSNLVYRLPTEAEWEYACRAGTTAAFYLGASLSSGQANFDGQYGYDSSVGQIFNPIGIFLQRTTSVGTYSTNNWGLYDMIGNVMEWCQDWYGDYPMGSVIDPLGPATGSSRIRRGGYWLLPAQNCRSAQRAKGVASEAIQYFGFRVVLSLL